MAELENNGFSAKKFYSEAPDSVAAHVIGHRNIVVDGSDEQGVSQNITGGNNNDYFGPDYSGSLFYDNANSSNSSRAFSNVSTMAGDSLFLKGRIKNEND